MGSERTIIEVMDDLPAGQTCVHYADLNVIALSARLDLAARERAICELHARLRREQLDLVASA